jgi:hypothetical protein
MEELDGDDGRLTAAGRVAERDIVQFVPFRAFSGPQTQASLAAVGKDNVLRGVDEGSKSLGLFVLVLTTLLLSPSPGCSGRGARSVSLLHEEEQDQPPCTTQARTGINCTRQLFATCL